MQIPQIKKHLSSLTPIALSGLDNVKLLNRVDSKFIIPIKRLPEILQTLKNNQYSVLEINDKRAFSYLTTYFDTSNYQFYRDHHNQHATRIKVRSRTYKESNLHFFEIKMKSNMRTNKYREELNTASIQLSAGQNNKIQELYTKSLSDKLTATLINSFTRITLVNKAKTERCTIDINITFKDPANKTPIATINDVVIIEVKQSKASVLSGIVASLRAMQIPQTSISKYVLGLILIHPEIKHNTFKPLLRKIEKIKTQQPLYSSI